MSVKLLEPNEYHILYNMLYEYFDIFKISELDINLIDTNTKEKLTLKKSDKCRYLIYLMIEANHNNYKLRYPDDISEFDNNFTKYFYLGSSKLSDLNIIRNKDNKYLILQALDYWLYQTNDYCSDELIYKTINEFVSILADNNPEKRELMRKGIPKTWGPLKFVP